MAKAERPIDNLQTKDELSIDDLDLGPIGPWATQTQFMNSKFFAELLNRLVTGRDMNIIVTAASETGVGKTTLAVSLAMLIDQHGWDASKASVADPADLSDLGRSRKSDGRAQIDVIRFSESVPDIRDQALQAGLQYPDRSIEIMD
jgi:Mrp family chromosome partitioning ATPase